MHQEQRQRTHELLKSKAVDRALFASPYSIKWLTGFAVPVQLGVNYPFIGGPPLVWYEDGHFTLFVSDAYTAETAAFDQQPDGSVVTYQSYTIEQPLAGAGHQATILRQHGEQAHPRSGRIGLEQRDVTCHVEAELREMVAAEVEFVFIDGWLEPLRMVKTDEELAKLRANFALTDIGHATARRVVAAGQREIDIWTTIHSAIQQAAGQRVPLGNDCVVGYRQANIGGWPLAHELKPSDSIIIDLSTLLHGYWSDSCATYVAGEPTAQQKAMHQTVTEALEFAASLLRPGAVAKEIDHQVRQFIAAAGYPVYPHHTGHGVGVSGHEAPRIVPYNNEVLQEGMVIMLEPATYLPGEIGVRLEDAFLITSDGVEVLTRHDKRL